jgi:hypothetical protein
VGIVATVIKTCEVCGKSFFCVPSHVVRRRTCSKKCQAILKKLEAKVTYKCVVCGKLFERRRSDYPNKTCSKTCKQLYQSQKIEKRCEICGAKYKVPWSRRKTSRYCSLQCVGKAKRVVKHWPSKVQLEDLMRRASLLEIAGIHGVSSNAVRYWCKVLGVKISRRLKKQKELYDGGN